MINISNLSPVTRGNTFTQTVNVTPTEGEEIVKVEAALDNDEGDDIEITPSASSFTVSGIIWDGWNDVFTYRELGEQENKNASSIGRMPPKKNLFDLDQDISDSITRNYTVQIKYDPMLFDGGSTTFDSSSLETIFDAKDRIISLTQQINNDYNAIKEFMANYEYNGTGAID